jgi:FAD/FMN-containing dehydrogenase
MRPESTPPTGTALDRATLRPFQDGLRGELLSPGDAGYDEARQLYNAMIDKHPALIARCAGVADVLAAVHFARSHDLVVAVRGGGPQCGGQCVV